MKQISDFSKTPLSKIVKSFYNCFFFETTTIEFFVISQKYCQSLGLNKNFASFFDTKSQNINFVVVRQHFSFIQFLFFLLTLKLLWCLLEKQQQIMLNSIRNTTDAKLLQNVFKNACFFQLVFEKKMCLGMESDKS